MTLRLSLMRERTLSLFSTTFGDGRCNIQGALATFGRAHAQRDKEIQFLPIEMGKLLKLYEVNASLSQFTLRNKRVGLTQTSCHLHLS
jgi:hypothetical protein